MPETLGLFDKSAPRPLADRLRPRSLDEVVGQGHLTGVEGVLTHILAQSNLPSLILWGGPGCGKTTIARLLAEEVDLAFEPLSAVFSGVADLKQVFERAKSRRIGGQGTLLFVDEIHRFNKAQQDSFLPFVENGTVILVGATTENPSFELNAALLSRARVLVLEALDVTAMEALLVRAEAEMGKALKLDEGARNNLCLMADGDGRYLLNMAESLLDNPPQNILTSETLSGRLQKRMPIYDKSNDSHYNLMSALHKSLRGSDCDAALYWFARMLDGGEDPNYIARRLLRFAYEDIGLADPAAAQHMLHAWQTYERLGSPEGELALANGLIYLATAPKSNAAYKAYKAAKVCAHQSGSHMPPKHILNAPTGLMKDLGYSKGYQYDHDAEDGFSGQDYFPEELGRQQFYQPAERGFERDIGKRLDYWQKLRDKR